MFRTDDIFELIKELDDYSEIFSKLNEDISCWFRSKYNELGLTDEILEDSLNCILSGIEEEQLPDKDMIKELKQKLKQKHRLVRVWEFELKEKGKPLVFEMQDGSFWQLCHAGLGWTQYQQIEPHWIEHPAIKPYLPADIILRPKDSKPWEYVFKLKAGSELWVKPGKLKKTFTWGIRTKKKDTEQQFESKK